MAKKNPPKIGEIRIGRAGNKYNKWDGKRWVPVSAARTAGASGRTPSVVSKPIPKTSSTSTKSTASRRGLDRISSSPVPAGTKRPAAKIPNRPRSVGGAAQLAGKGANRRWVKQVPVKKKQEGLLEFLAKQDKRLRGK